MSVFSLAALSILAISLSTNVEPTKKEVRLDDVQHAEKIFGGVEVRGFELPGPTTDSSPSFLQVFLATPPEYDLQFRSLRSKFLNDSTSDPQRVVAVLMDSRLSAPLYLAGMILGKSLVLRHERPADFVEFKAQDRIKRLRSGDKTLGALKSDLRAEWKILKPEIAPSETESHSDYWRTIDKIEILNLLPEPSKVISGFSGEWKPVGAKSLRAFETIQGVQEVSLGGEKFDMILRTYRLSGRSELFGFFVFGDRFKRSLVDAPEFSVERFGETILELKKTGEVTKEKLVERARFERDEIEALIKEKFGEALKIEDFIALGEKYFLSWNLGVWGLTCATQKTISYALTPAEPFSENSKGRKLIGANFNAISSQWMRPVEIDLDESNDLFTKKGLGKIDLRLWYPSGEDSMSLQLINLK